MSRRALLRVLREFERVRRARDDASARRALARLEIASRVSLPAAILGAVLRLHLERPALLPFLLALLAASLLIDSG